MRVLKFTCWLRALPWGSEPLHLDSLWAAPPWNSLGLGVRAAVVQWEVWEETAKKVLMNDRRASFSVKAVTGVDCFHVSLVTFSLLVSLRLRRTATECARACGVRITSGISKASAFLHRCHSGGLSWAERGSQSRWGDRVGRGCMLWTSGFQIMHSLAFLPVHGIVRWFSNLSPHQHPWRAC